MLVIHHPLHLVKVERGVIIDDALERLEVQGREGGVGGAGRFAVAVPPVLRPILRPPAVALAKLVKPLRHGRLPCPAPALIPAAESPS